MKLGCNENPMLSHYMYNELKLQIAKANMVKIMKGNTRWQNDNETLIDITDTTPLSKRQKKEWELHFLCYPIAIELKGFSYISNRSSVIITYFNIELRAQKS